MIIASGSMALLLSLILLTRGLWPLFLFYGAFGLAEALFWPPAMGWLAAGKEDRELNRAIARFNLMWSTGTILGPLWGGLLVQRNSAFALGTGAVLFAGVLLLTTAASLTLPQIRRDRVREPLPQPGTAGPQQGSILRFPAWTGLFAGYVVIGVLISVFPLYARDGLGLPESRIGVLLLLRTFAATVGFLLLGRAVFWHHRFWPMTAALGGIIGVLVLMILLQGFVALGLLLAALGLLLAVGYNSSIFHGTAGTAQRAQRMGIHEAVLTAGAVAGASVGGMVYQRFSMDGVLAVAAAVVGAALLAQALLFLRLRNRETTLRR
jgi:predicted MFS family arabinose efflux permease